MTSVLTENERESIKGGKTHQDRYVSSSGSAESLSRSNIFCHSHLFTSINTYLENPRTLIRRTHYVFDSFSRPSQILPAARPSFNGFGPQKRLFRRPLSCRWSAMAQSSCHRCRIRAASLGSGLGPVLWLRADGGSFGCFFLSVNLVNLLMI